MSRKRRSDPDATWDFTKGIEHKKAAKRGMTIMHDAFDTAPEPLAKKEARDHWVKSMDWKYREKKGIT